MSAPTSPDRRTLENDLLERWRTAMVRGDGDEVERVVEESHNHRDLFTTSSPLFGGD